MPFFVVKSRIYLTLLIKLCIVNKQQMIAAHSARGICVYNTRFVEYLAAMRNT